MAPPIVSVLYYHDWPSHLLSGLRKQGLNNKVIWVNNLPDQDVRSEYLDENCEVVSGSVCRSHGGGIDVGFAHAKRQGYDYALHVEPDCSVSGTVWYEDLTTAVKDGATLAGPWTMGSGLHHPCISIWELGKIKESFKIQPRVQMPDPDYFDAMGNIKEIVKHAKTPLAIWMLTAFWDSGLLNAYEMKRTGKVVTTRWDGIIHHWEGRSKPAPD